MNDRLQLFPTSDVHQSGLQDASFVRSWIVYECGNEFAGTSSRLNWNAVLGLALAFGVSASFWAGAGFLIARLWR
jgi:hypothetical protein